MPRHTSAAIDMVGDYSGPLREQALELAENVSFCAKKLQDARRADKKDPHGLTVPYDNGGGQRGTRENPEFKAYVNVLKQYTQSLKSLADLVGSGAVEAAENRFGRFVT